MIKKASQKVQIELMRSLLCYLMWSKCGQTRVSMIGTLDDKGLWPFLHHAAHSAHATHSAHIRHAWFVFVRFVSNNSFSCQEHSCHGSGVLQCGTCYFRWI